MKKTEKLKLLKDIEKKKLNLYKNIDKLNEQEKNIIVNCIDYFHYAKRVTVAHYNDPYCGGYDYDVVRYWCTVNLKNEDRLCHRFKKIKENKKC